jgi:hypothetical protein
MKRSVIASSDLNLGLAKMLLVGVDASLWTKSFGDMTNHPAWQIGHLVASSNLSCKLLGGESWIDASWEELFKMGSVPTDDPTSYPGKDELWAALKNGHERVQQLFEQADDARLNQELEKPHARERFGTVGNLVVFLMTSHEMFHLGQLSYWRRAAGLGSAM